MSKPGDSQMELAKRVYKAALRNSTPVREIAKTLEAEARHAAYENGNELPPAAPDFARLRELEAKATPGPWCVRDNFRICGYTARANEHLQGYDAENNYGPEEIGQTFTIRKFTKERYHALGQSDSYSAEAAANDAEFIALARNELPALLSRLDTLEREREQMREALEKARCMRSITAWTRFTTCKLSTPSTRLRTSTSHSPRSHAGRRERGNSYQ